MERSAVISPILTVEERRIMTEDTMVAPAPAASPAPSSAPAPAPATTPVAASAAASSVDPGKFPIREDYAAALLTEKLGAIASPEEAAAEPVVEAAEPVEFFCWLLATVFRNLTRLNHWQVRAHHCHKRFWSPSFFCRRSLLNGNGLQISSYDFLGNAAEKAYLPKA